MPVKLMSRLTGCKPAVTVLSTCCKQLRENFVVHCVWQLQPDFRSALFNVALLIANDLQRPLQAVPYLKQLLQVSAATNWKSWAYSYAKCLLVSAYSVR